MDTEPQHTPTGYVFHCPRPKHFAVDLQHFCPPGAGTAGYMFRFCFLFSKIGYLLGQLSQSLPADLRQILWFVEIRLQMINLKLVFRSLHRRCLGNQFLKVLSTELIFVTPVASVAAGQANVGFCIYVRFLLYALKSVLAMFS